MKEDQKIVIYQTPDGKTQIDVRLENETVWLTQAQMAELFEKDQSVVARHINNAFKEGELEKESNMHFLHNTQYKYRPTMIYSLDVIISVGYRVHSKRGTAFRISCGLHTEMGDIPPEMVMVPGILTMGLKVGFARTQGDSMIGVGIHDAAALRQRGGAALGKCGGAKRSNHLTVLRPSMM